MSSAETSDVEGRVQTKMSIQPRWLVDSFRQLVKRGTFFFLVLFPDESARGRCGRGGGRGKNGREGWWGKNPGGAMREKLCD